jgi:hypothetical protein
MNIKFDRAFFRYKDNGIGYSDEIVSSYKNTRRYIPEVMNLL